MDHKSWRFQNKLGWRIDANIRAGRTKEAEALWLAGIRQAQDHFGTNHPVTAAFYDTRATLLHETGRPREAAKVMEQHVLPVFRRGFGTNHSRTLQAEFGVARGWEKAGELERTINCYSNLYERVSAKLPVFWARRQLGLMATFLTSQRRYDLVRAVRGPLCTAYEANPPTNAEEFEWFIQAAATTKGWPDAVDVCRKYFDRFANVPTVCRTVGTVFLYVGDEDGYRKVTTKAIALAPTTTNWEGQLAILHIAARGPFNFSAEQTNQCEALIQSVERGATPPQQARAHRAIGAMQLRIGDLTNALAHLEKALTAALEPAGRARTLLIKALCLHHLNRADEARAAFDGGEKILKPLLFDRLSESEDFLTDADRYDILLRREAQALLGLKEL